MCLCHSIDLIEPLQIVVGSVAAKAPSSNMASSAFTELCLAVDLFEREAGTSEREKAALVSSPGIAFAEHLTSPPPI